MTAGPPLFYRLDGHEPVPVVNEDLVAFSATLKARRPGFDPNRVADTWVGLPEAEGSARVSTVFLSVDHRFVGTGPDLITDTKRLLAIVATPAAWLARAPGGKTWSAHYHDGSRTPVWVRADVAQDAVDQELVGDPMVNPHTGHTIYKCTGKGHDHAEQLGLGTFGQHAL